MESKEETEHAEEQLGICPVCHRRIWNKIIEDHAWGVHGVEIEHIWRIRK